MVNIKPRTKRPLPERPVIIQCEDLCLEGLFLRKGKDFLPAVLNSPHPQLGGTMDAPFLNELAYALAKHEISTLRYNYRGVGASQGEYTGGEGEQKDMHSAIEFLLETVYEEGDGAFVSAGYSFGSWIGFQLAFKDVRMKRFLMVAPPIQKYDFSQLPQCKTRIGILVGDKDQICPVSELRSFLDGLKKENPDWQTPPVYVVPQASHYFVRGLVQAGEAGSLYLRSGVFPAEE